MKKNKCLYEVGEFKLIEAMRRWTGRGRALVGIGDDAALLCMNAKKETLFTTDMLIENKHFKIKEATPFEIGWKAMAVNISDIAAMGGIPTYAVAAVGLPKKLKMSFIKEIYRGMRAVMDRFHVELVGGDTNQSEELVISVALLGQARASAVIKRSGAKVGDVVFVTGDLGGSYASKKHLRFIPRVEEAQFLIKNFNIHAMMDLSDGLASDIHRLTEASRVGAVISRDALPLSSPTISMEQALTEGEDFELLFTMSPEDAARLGLYPPRKNGVYFNPVGKIIPKKQGLRLVGSHGYDEPLLERGFDHFKK